MTAPPDTPPCRPGTAPEARCTVHTPAGLVTVEHLVLESSSTGPFSTAAATSGGRLDVHTAHAWLDHPGSAFWGMRGATVPQVEDLLSDWVANPHRSMFLIRLDGLRVALAVFYDPSVLELAGRYPHEPGDLGMHLLVAPTRTPVRGTTAAVMGAICETAFSVPLLADTPARRMVVEPDLGNTAVHRLNSRAGFREAGPLVLPDKTALLSTCTAEEYRGSEIGRSTTLISSSSPTRAPGTPTHSPRPALHDHLVGHAMRRAHRHLCAKALAEFSHERLLTPEPHPRGTLRQGDERSAAAPGEAQQHYAVHSGGETWTFRARRLPLDHWVIEEGSIRRLVDDVETDVDAQALVIAFAPRLGIPDDLMGTYLEEIAATLGSAAFCLHHRDRPSRELANADLQTIESAMTEGHPGFVANNGRVGLGLTDRHRYTPEARTSTRLVWLAVRRDRSLLTTVEGLDERAHTLREFTTEALAGCDDRLRRLGLDPGDYRILPVHPHQWDRTIAVAFAPDLARRDLVHLGESDDEYRPQQSVRTFLNLTRPERGYVKTALAVQNMGFTRGLSPRYMRDTPAVNDWVAALVDSDPVLRDLGLGVLREVAAIGYTGDAHHVACEAGVSDEGPHTKMIAALWRESPIPRLETGERAFTLAALLHVDLHGRPLVAEFIERSGLRAEEWVHALLDAYLLPVAWCLLVHGLVFMPHGENVILVVGPDHTPRRALFKDIGEEVAVIRDLPGRPLPARLGRIRHIVDAETAALSIHTDVMDGVLRHLAAILDEAGMLDAREFWMLTRHRLLSLAERERADELHRPTWDALFAPTFRHSCLNRLQLRDARQMVDLTDQAGSLQFAGRLDNPVSDAAASAAGQLSRDRLG